MKTLLPLALVFALPSFAQTETPAAASTIYALSQLDQAPKPLTRVAPQAPQQFLQRGVSGEALCVMTISTTGEVTAVDIIRSTHPELAEPSIAALLQWKFKPGQKAGQPVACSIEQLIAYAAPKNTPRPTATGPRPTLKEGSSYKTPEAFFKHGEDGQVIFLTHVSEKGRVTSVEFISASHDELIEPAKATLLKWRYAPAVIDDKEVASQIDQTVKFRGPRTEKERRIAIAAAGKIYTSSELDQPPSVEKSIDPSYPYQFLSQKKPGRVQTELVLSSKGKVLFVKILTSTHEDFSKAAEDALYLWRFKPAMKDGNPVACRLEFPIEFNAPQ